MEQMISESVRIKCEVVTADEKEGDLRRILNFGHTIGHALESETQYARFLHGEAVSFGMTAATHLAQSTDLLDKPTAHRVHEAIHMYGPIPSTAGIEAGNLLARLARDKKTIQGSVHFVLPTGIGSVTITSGIAEDKVIAAITAALA